LLLLSERRNYASKELLKFYLMASLKSSNMQMNPVAATLNKPLFYAIRPLRNILSKFWSTRMYSINLITIQLIIQDMITWSKKVPFLFQREKLYKLSTLFQWMSIKLSSAAGAWSHCLFTSVPMSIVTSSMNSAPNSLFQEQLVVDLALLGLSFV